MLEQQSSQYICPVFCFDLIRDDHLLNHLVSNARQSLLVQVEENSSYTGEEKLT